MTKLKLDHTSIVVEDLPAAVAFFAALGMTEVGSAPITGDWVDRINNLKGIRVDIVMMRAADGDGQLELTKFHSPELVDVTPAAAPPNALGLRSIMFGVEDVDAMVARLKSHGGELIGEIIDYGDQYRLCYMRGPAGIIVALAEEI